MGDHTTLLPPLTTSLVFSNFGQDGLHPTSRFGSKLLGQQENCFVMLQILLLDWQLIMRTLMGHQKQHHSTLVATVLCMMYGER